jgi:phosphoglycerate dehydrogenase-like enzyme
MPAIVILMPQNRVQAAGITLPATWDVRFLEAPTVGKIIAACRGAEAIISMGSVAAIGADVIAGLTGVKLIQCLGAGFNHVNIAAADRRGIAVANSPGENAAAVAEFTVGAIIALQRRLVESDAAIKAGDYGPFRKQALDAGLGEIAGSRIGLVGFGDIGRQVARIAGLLGASVGYYAAHRRPQALEEALNVTYRPFDDLLAGSDIVSLHVPLNEATRGLIGERELALMPVGSLLINTARGEVVDQTALAAALEAGHLAGAAVDTFWPEPPGAGHPLLSLSPDASRRLLMTPHTAGVTAGSFRRMLAASVANIERVLRGEAPKNVVGGVRA